MTAHHWTGYGQLGQKGVEAFLRAYFAVPEDTEFRIGTGHAEGAEGEILVVAVVGTVATAMPVSVARELAAGLTMVAALDPTAPKTGRALALARRLWAQADKIEQLERGLDPQMLTPERAALVEDVLDGKVICAECGATLNDYPRRCRLQAGKCPGLQTIVATWKRVSLN